MYKMKLLVLAVITTALISLPALAADETTELGSGISFGVKAITKQLIDSHTTYEFGMPLDPKYTPLSRLEFDLDSTWGGIGMNLDTPAGNLNFSVLLPITDNINGELRDYDWYQDGSQSNYSESDLRMDSGIMLDISYDIDLVSKFRDEPTGWQLGPVVGFRYQKFDMVASNLTQWNYFPNSPTTVIRVQGDGIAFQQSYEQFYGGIKAAYVPIKGGDYPKFGCSAQVDLAYVQGENRDHHLLREGRRYTFESTDGHAWHGNISASVYFSEAWSLSLSGDYLKIDTDGTHRWVNSVFGVDESWDYGVEAYSKQIAVSLTLSYEF